MSKLGDVVSHVNCRAARDEALRPGTNGHRDVPTSAEYFAEVLPLSAQFLEDHPHIGRRGRETDAMGGSPRHLIGITHEICSVHSLDATRELLEILPPIRMTLDAEQWLQFSANRCQDEEAHDEAIDLDVIPHVDHVRARIVDAASGSIRVSPREEELWKRVWTRKALRGAEQVTVTPDVNSVVGREARYLSRDVADVTARIRQCFGDWSADYSDKIRHNPNSLVG